MPRDRAVHDDERTRNVCGAARGRVARGGRRQRRGRAQPDVRLTARPAAPGQQPHARHLPFQRAQRRNGRCLLQLGRVDVTDREGELLGLRRLRDTRDHHLVERHRIELQLEVRRLIARCERDLLGRRRVADAARAQRYRLAFGPLGWDRHRVHTRDGGCRRQAVLVDHDDRSAQGVPASAHDLACNDRGLRVRVADGGPEQHEQPRGAENYVEQTTLVHDAPFGRR